MSSESHSRWLSSSSCWKVKCEVAAVKPGVNNPPCQNSNARKVKKNAYYLLYHAAYAFLG